MSNTLPAPAHLPMARELRLMMPMWSVAAFLPLPVLVAIDPSRSAPVSCLYLGVINAWLVTQCWQAWGLPESSASWRSRILAVTVAVLANVALFVGFGLLAGVQTRFPFALMALLSAIPAIGITPWMLRLLPQNPYAGIVFGGFLVGSCKIAACVVARIVYGPDYISQG